MHLDEIPDLLLVSRSRALERPRQPVGTERAFTGHLCHAVTLTPIKVMGKSRRRQLDPVGAELQKLIDLGTDQLDIEMKELSAQNASLISQWILWEMAMKEQSFEEISIELCRMIFKQHMAITCARAGAKVQEHLDEHTIDGSD